jgi:hypothetical protein
MTDITSSTPFDQNFNVVRKYKDMGDGTYSEIVASVTIPSAIDLPTTINTGQVKIAVTGTAVQLQSNALVNGLIIKSISSNNAANQTVGASTVTNTTDGTGNGYILFPGEAASFGVSNSNAVWVNGTIGDIFTWEGN